MSIPFFSIIIPTYNSAHTISVCLDSIMKQNFKDFEVVIVDGVSTDDTITIVQSYQHEDFKITYSSEKDQGIYDAMNKGIKKAKGEWLYFMGSDDKLFSTEVLQKVAEAFKEDDHLDVIYGNIFSKRFNGIYDGEFTNEKILNQNLCHQAIFLRKTVLKQIGNFNTTFKSWADWDHNLKWFLSKKIKKKYLNMVMAEYADGGFSSLNLDNNFLKVKSIKYICYGHRHLTTQFKYATLKSEFILSCRKKDYKYSIYILFHSPFILF